MIQLGGRGFTARYPIRRFGPAYVEHMRHKVIDPLFLNALTDELASIINEPGVGAVKRRNNLKRYHDKLAGLTFFEAFNPTWVQNGGALALAT